MWKAEYKDAAVDSPQGLWFANPGGSNSIPSRTHSSVQRTRSLPVHTTPQTMVMFQQSGKEGAQRPRFPRSHLHTPAFHSVGGSDHKDQACSVCSVLDYFKLGLSRFCL